MLEFIFFAGLGFIAGWHANKNKEYLEGIFNNIKNVDLKQKDKE